MSSWRSLECSDLVTVMKEKRLHEQAVLNLAGYAHNEAKDNNKHNDRNDDLDVLSSLKTARSKRRIYPIEDDGDAEVVNDIESGIYQVSQPTSLNVGNSNTIASSSSSSSMITSPAFMASKISDIKKKIRKVGRLTSIKSQLYALSGILLLGLIITKINTVTLINDEGKTWATECSANLGKYMDCYKAAVVKYGLIDCLIHYSTLLYIHYIVYYSIESDQKINLDAVVKAKKAFVEVSATFYIISVVPKCILSDELS